MGLVKNIFIGVLCFIGLLSCLIGMAILLTKIFDYLLKIGII